VGARLFFIHFSIPKTVVKMKRNSFCCANNGFLSFIFAFLLLLFLRQGTYVCVCIFLIFLIPFIEQKKTETQKTNFSTHQFEVHKDLNTNNLRIDWQATATGDATGPNVHGACPVGLQVRPVERVVLGGKRVKNGQPSECFSTSMG
jgi:hypothetical protein